MLAPAFSRRCRRPGVISPPRRGRRGGRAADPRPRPGELSRRGGPGERAGSGRTAPADARGRRTARSLLVLRDAASPRASRRALLATALRDAPPTLARHRSACRRSPVLTGGTRTPSARPSSAASVAPASRGAVSPLSRWTRGGGGRGGGIVPTVATGAEAPPISSTEGGASPPSSGREGGYGGRRRDGLTATATRRSTRPTKARRGSAGGPPQALPRSCRRWWPRGGGRRGRRQEVGPCSVAFGEAVPFRGVVPSRSSSVSVIGTLDAARNAEEHTSRQRVTAGDDAGDRRERGSSKENWAMDASAWWLLRNNASS